jgi:hypothetical protein
MKIIRFEVVGSATVPTAQMAATVGCPTVDERY